MRVSESAWPDGECVQEVSHVTCHVTSVPCMGGSGSDPVRHRKRSQPDPNQTGPQRGSGFRPSARTGPGSGLGSGEYGLQTGPNRTVATIINACDLYFTPCRFLLDPELKKMLLGSRTQGFVTLILNKFFCPVTN